MTSLKTAQQELRDRRSWLALEYKRTTDALEALDALSNEAAASRVKPQQAKRRPRGSVTEAIRAAAVAPVKAGEIASKTGIDQQQLAVQMSKMAKRGELIRVGVGLYQRADCLETAAQPKPAPVDVHEFASAQ